MNFKEVANNIEKHFQQNDENISRLLNEDKIEFVINKQSLHPSLICRMCGDEKEIAEVSYDYFNKYFYVTNSLEDIKKIMFPLEEGEEEVIEYFQQAISDEFDLSYDEINERNRILLKLSDFASLLKEERNNEKKRVEELGPINWLSEEELVSTDRLDVPIRKEAKTFIRLGYLEDRRKYVLMEIVKTYLDKELLDVSQNVFEFQIESVEVILSLLKKVVGKTIKLS